MIAAGLGFGLTYALVMYGGVLGAALTPGDYFTEACPAISGFIVSAILALLFQVLNIALMVLMLDAVRNANQNMMLLKIAGIVGLHLAATFSALFNQDGDLGGCATGMTLTGLSVLAACGSTVFAVKQPSYGKEA